MPRQFISPYQRRPPQSSFPIRCLRSAYRFRQLILLFMGLSAVYFTIYSVLMSSESEEKPKNVYSERNGIAAKLSKLERREDVILSNEAYDHIEYNNLRGSNQEPLEEVITKEKKSDLKVHPFTPRKRNSILGGNVKNRMESIIEPTKASKKKIDSEEKNTIDEFLNKEIKFSPDNNYNEETEDENALDERHNPAKETKGSSILDGNEPFGVSGNEWGKAINDEDQNKHAMDFGEKERESGVGHGSLSKLQLNIADDIEVKKGKSLNTTSVDTESLSNMTKIQNETDSNETVTKAIFNITDDGISKLSNRTLEFNTTNHTTITNKTDIEKIVENNTNVNNSTVNSSLITTKFKVSEDVYQSSGHEDKKMKDYYGR